MRCSCHEYRQLAQGSADFCINTHSAVWDHAAGTLILTEAGGCVGFLDGTPYGAKSSLQPLIAAQSRRTLDRLRDHLRAVPGLA
ncbi:MAG: inositol monophosphatase family protein [Paracoccaceae bacterium]